MRLTRRAIVRLGGVFGLGALLEWLESLVSTADDTGADDETNESAATDTDTDTDPDDPSSDDTAADSTQPTDDETGDWETPDEGPIEAVEIVDVDDADGADNADEDGLESPLLSIRNADAESRSLSVRIDHDDATVLERTGTVPGDAALEIAVTEAGTYETTVESEHLRSTTSMTVSADCDESHTEITLGETGIETNTSISC